MGDPRMDNTTLSKHGAEKVGWDFLKDHSNMGCAPVAGLPVHSKAAWSFDESVSSSAKSVISKSRRWRGDEGIDCFLGDIRLPREQHIHKLCTCTQPECRTSRSWERPATGMN